MDSFNLLLILPDTKNENILVIEYDKPVGENVGFDNPQGYNDFFLKTTSIPVFRRYTFNTKNYVVFVFEMIDQCDTKPADGYSWIPYSQFMDKQNDDEIREIAKSVSLYYHKSKNMPWVNETGFLPYFDWLHGVCAEKNMQINGMIAQVKNAYVSTVFCVPTDGGNLYMKIPGKLYLSELPFTRELMKWGIAELPVWVDFDLDRNVVLMKDMGGHDLPSRSDIDTLKTLVIQFSHIQKDSIQHLQSVSHFCNDYRVDTILGKLDSFLDQTFEILAETRYRLTQDELVRLKRNITCASELLETVNDLPIPDTIQHGDVRPGNIRIVEGKRIFYDWSCCAISHPFIEIILFLHVIRRNLPADVQAKEILVNVYLQEWLEYGTIEELRNAFSILDDMKELFMVYPDYCWVDAIYSASNEPINPMSADGWLLERRNYYFARVLRRFIEKVF